MALLTISAASAGSIPGKAGRKALVMNLESGDAKWGFEPNTSVGGATQGLPMVIGQPIAFAGEAPDSFVAPIYFASTAGCTITWTQKS